MERILTQFDDFSDWLATGRRAIRPATWVLILSLPGILLVLFSLLAPSTGYTPAAATAACLGALTHLIARD